MYLEIVTPVEKVFQGEVDSVTFPGTDGSFQILNSHAPLISTLKNGIIKYHRNKGKLDALDGTLKVNGGVVEVKNNSIIVLAEGTSSN